MSLVLKLAAKGDGVTEDGRHVAFTAPGDVVDIDATIHPGPHHVAPPCRHFPKCGGCQLQHVDDASYTQFLIDRVAGALGSQRIARVEIRAPHLSPPKTRRRAALRAERIGNRIVLGFNEGASHRIVDLAECHVLHPELFRLVAPVRALLGTLMGRKKPAEVRLTLTDQGVDLLISDVTAEGLEASEALTAFAAANGLARLSIDDGQGAQAWWEPESVTVTLGGIAVPFAAGAFLQATADGEAALLAGVRESVGDAALIADLFAGLGTFALPLSAEAKVLAVEGAREPALALKGAAMRTMRTVAVEHRDLFRRPLSTAELDRFDAVVLDPPRAGAKEQMEALAATAKVRRISYVSCNPATFSRDVMMLAGGGWRLDWVRPVGQFRWSTHVELVASLSR